MARFILSALVASACTLVHAQSLKLATKHQGQTFFDGWNANASATDPTNGGPITYLGNDAARGASLISVNSAGNAIVKVDNTTDDPNPGPFSQFRRNSVLLMAKDTIDLGTLVVMDAVHIPFGCSVWPAFWTLDSVSHTDEGGEIDIIEYVNQMQTNQFSLHAREGCKLVKSDSMPFSGEETFDDCNFVFNVTGNRGCGAKTSAAAKTVGQAFAQNGGGVYAMYWSTDGISMWFFQRSDIPDDLTKESPNPKSWGTPIASFPAAGCDPRSFFNPQTMIINTDICGIFADAPGLFNADGCTGKCVETLPKASNYDNAYWEIKYVKTFTEAGSANASATSGGSGAANSTASTGAAGAGETGKSASERITGSAWAAGLFALVGFGLVL